MSQPVKICRNKKAFHSNVNHLLPDSRGFIVNRFEHVWEVGKGDLGEGELALGSSTKKGPEPEHVHGGADLGPCIGIPPPVNRQNDRQIGTTEIFTFTTPLADGNKELTIESVAFTGSAVVVD